MCGTRILRELHTHHQSGWGRGPQSENNNSTLPVVTDQYQAQYLARGLARAFMASDADRHESRDRLCRALGRDWPWLGGLQDAVWQAFGAHGGAGLAEHGDKLAALIAAHPPLLGALEAEGERPRLRGYFTAHPRMEAMPVALPGLAMPSLASAGELAAWLKLTPDELEWFAGVKGRPVRQAAEPLSHYRYRWIVKRSGGSRLLEIPKRRLAAMQRRILDEILYFVPPHEAAHGFRPRHSTLSHATPHVGQDAVLRMDLRDYFVSVRASRVHAMFHTLGFPATVASLLTGLVCNITPKPVLRAQSASTAGLARQWRELSAYFQPHLPQGAPTSPALANLCSFNLDLRLGALAADAGAAYTRYADDLAFSGSHAFARGAERFKVVVATIAAGEGYAINPRKTRLMHRSGRQQLTGVVVNLKPNIRRDDYERLKATLHNCLRHGATSQNREGLPDFRMHLQGRIAHVRRFNPVRAERLAEDFRAIVWDD
jgi:hypothetical protein